MLSDSFLAIVRVIADLTIYVWLCVKPSWKLAAENFFLRKQLALYKERQIKVRLTNSATRFTMAFLSQRFDWHDALMIVQRRTLPPIQRQIGHASRFAKPFCRITHTAFRCMIVIVFSQPTLIKPLRILASSRLNHRDGVQTVNAICDRVIGTLRRECLDYVIPLSESDLRRIMQLWVTHYNRSRQHSVIGPDLPSQVATPSADVVRLPKKIKP